MNIDSILKVVRGIVKLRGDTDGTLIGNVKNKLRTTSQDSLFSVIENEQAFNSTTDFNTLTGTTEKPYFLLRNPGSNTKPILTTFFEGGLDSVTARTIARIYADPTITADGTALTENNTYIKTSPATSTIDTFKLPTISANGTLLDIKIIAADQSSAGRNRFFLVDPGHDILVTVENSIANVSMLLAVFWIEEI